MSTQMKAIIDKLLTNVSSAYVPVGLVADQILPVVTSKQTSGKLGKYGTGHLRIEQSVKGGQGMYRRISGITRSTDTYTIEGHGLEGVVTSEDYRNVELPFKAEEDETMALTVPLMLEREKALADALTNASVMTQTVALSGTAQFSDYMNSDPLSIFTTAHETIITGCGMVPNVMIMDILVWNKLRFHPQLLDTLGYKYARPGGLVPQEVASALGVEKILVAQARYESAKEGQTSSLAACWGKHIVLAHVPAKAMPYQVSLGYCVRYEGEQPRKVYKYDINNPPESKAILVEDSYDDLLSNVKAGYLIKDAVA